MKPPIIVLGPGRCGSTLLQRILNTSDKITLWGEHAAFLTGIARSYYLLKESPLIKTNYYKRNIDSSLIIGSLKDYNKSINWLNSFNQEIIDQSFKKLIIDVLNQGAIQQGLNLETTTWGFKEILYTKNDRVFDMWLELFPNTKIIFSVRDPFHVIKSMILSWTPPQELKNMIENRNFTKLTALINGYSNRWQNSVSSFQYWIEEKQVNCYIEKYEDLIVDPQKSVDKIFNYLGYPIPPNVLEPMLVKVEVSQHSPYAKTVSQLIYNTAEQIWDNVKVPAKYFGYKLDDVQSFNV